jgi:hypothetical protein
MTTSARVAKAEPFSDFWGLRSTTAHPNQKPRPHRSSYKHKKSPTSDASNSHSSGRPVTAPPNRRNVLVAKAASANQQKTDMQYGTPVPGKPGLVVSPFAPDTGYVDVTGFPPGTEELKSKIQAKKVHHVRRYSSLSL